MEPTIKRTDPLTVAFKVMHGAFEQMPEGYSALYGWIEHYGLRPVGMPQALFLTLPSITPEGDAEWELWAPIAGGAGETGPDEGGFGVKRIEPEVVASLTHKGPYEEIGSDFYTELERWAEENGYHVIGPPREIYYSDPEVAPEETVTELQMPVAKA